MSAHNTTVIVKLSEPTVFSDLNQKEGKPTDFARDAIEVQRLKFKHFREMQGLKEEEQMQYALKTLTGLSTADLDELYAEDAAEITTVIYGFMSKYLTLAKKMMDDASRKS